ncbi:MAG: tyrosine-type recombinase/integrase [Deltaproteobacteria bacterium]|nr:tyrosine-type recombinase/integrase [Deltaproteobacteria bacterium]
MGDRSVRITERIASSARAEREYTYVWDAQQPGLGLRVRSTGRKLWVMRWSLGRRQVIKTIGVYKETELGEVVMAVADARRVAREMRVTVDRGEDPSPEAGRRPAGKTIAARFPEFIEHKRKREGLTERTLEGYQAHFDLHLSSRRYGVADLPVTALTKREIVALQRGVADGARERAAKRLEAARASGAMEKVAKLERKLPYAGNGAANKVVLTLSSFCAWLVASGELEINPCDGVGSLPTAGRDEESVLTRADAVEALQLIREHAPNHSFRDALLLVALTAQRDSDIRERRWEDVVLTDPEVSIPYLRVDKHKSLRRTKRAKLVPLAPEALTVLLERWPSSTLRARCERDEWVVVDEATEERWPIYPSSAWADQLPRAQGFIFPSRVKGKPIWGLWHAWEAVREHSQRKRVRASDVHGLRHAGASLMRAMGMSKEEIKDALAHSHAATTEIYLHRTPDFYTELARQLRTGLGLEDGSPER